MKNRLTYIRNVPLTTKEIDWLTAAEFYLIDLLDLPLIEFVGSCFPKVAPNHLEQVQKLWEYAIAAFHLKQKKNMEKERANTMIVNATRIYELEIQRVVGAIFPLEHPFWKTFYQRQEVVSEDPLLALDALQHLSNMESQISYQLLLQAVKSILNAHYFHTEEDLQHYQNAQRLIANLSLTDFQIWIGQQMGTANNN